MSRLILLRHGESEWNTRNLFTGRADVALTRRGEQQSRDAGTLLRTLGLAPDAAHCSVLRRAWHTCALAMDAAGRGTAPVAAVRALAERDYGSLQGRNKEAVRREVGEREFRRIRRSADARPPGGESLDDVSARLLPYWHAHIAPRLGAGATVLVVGHSNSLRCLAAHLDALSPTELLDLELLPGTPLLYELDPALLPLRRGGRHLHPAGASGAVRTAGSSVTHDR
ncbi:2,3-bisphosphoglycerate-dependent phosphoglycerate mutase [Streptomyces sp. MMCC 100]|uniref:2,3-bisphosphoglycerate-dependent phosphoglycerate mutase n=1 Tax=Streptomyces sp. MMCC 100 TaxID=3163555 RepID=UPI0035950A91